MATKRKIINLLYRSKSIFNKVEWRDCCGFDAICLCPLIDHGQQPMKIHTEVTLLYIRLYQIKNLYTVIVSLIFRGAWQGKDCSRSFIFFAKLKSIYDQCCVYHCDGSDFRGSCVFWKQSLSVTGEINCFFLVMQFEWRGWTSIGMYVYDWYSYHHSKHVNRFKF